MKTALAIKLDHNKDHIDKPIGCEVYGSEATKATSCRGETADCPVRNRDGICRSPRRKLGIKLSDIIPDHAGVLNSDNLVFIVTHKQLNDLFDDGQAWE